MTLISRTHQGFGNSFGSRSVSMFETLGETLVQNLSEDTEVQIWVNALKSDPAIRLTTATTHEVGFYLTTALKAANSIVNLASLPITYPLANYYKKQQENQSAPFSKVTKCPFPPARVAKVTGRGEIVIRKNNAFDNLLQDWKNFSFGLQLSNNIFLRSVCKIGSLVISLPSRLQITEPSKNSLVLMAIRTYFPKYNEAKFTEWLEESFLPCLTNFYLRGMANSLKTVAETSIVQERQMAIADYVISGFLIKSRLLSVYNVEIMDYDFKGHKPIITVRFSADHTEHILSKKGQTIAGAPDEIKKSDFLVLLTINENGAEPVWKANEIHVGQVSDRI